MKDPHVISTILHR